MPGTFGLWGDSLDHLVHLLVAFVLALPIGWHRRTKSKAPAYVPSRWLRWPAAAWCRPRYP